MSSDNAPDRDIEELKARTSVVRQAWRSAVLNTEMTLLVVKGHH